VHANEALRHQRKAQEIPHFCEHLATFVRFGASHDARVVVNEQLLAPQSPHIDSFVDAPAAHGLANGSASRCESSHAAVCGTAWPELP